jgi:hypothetical protein
VRVHEQAELGLARAQVFLKFRSTEWFTHYAKLSWYAASAVVTYSGVPANVDLAELIRP